MQIAVRAGFLGQIFGLGFYVFQYAPAQVYIFGIYMAIMSFFHYSEYLTIAIIKPKELTTKSFMLSHSPAYIGAALTSWIEFGLESYFFPGNVLDWIIFRILINNVVFRHKSLAICAIHRVNYLYWGRNR